MLLLIAIYSVIAILLIFVITGMFLVVRAMRLAAKEQRRENPEAGRLRGLKLRQRVKRYVGPASPKMALLNPPARVGIEFFGSLCGFPGLGWMISGRIAIGLPLFAIGPAITWAVYPLYLSMSNEIMAGPYVVLRYLPVLAATSAGLLANSEFRYARRRQIEEAQQ